MTDANYNPPSGTFENTAPRNDKNKNLLLLLLLIGLLGSWGYFLWSNNKSGKKITAQQGQINALDSSKTAIQLEFDNALVRLDSLRTTTGNLQDQLTGKQKEIESKKAEIRRILNDRNASKAELAKAKTMVADLNEKISGLEAEVARLTGENRELTTANASLKQEKVGLETNLQTTTAEKVSLEKTVDVASTFSASNIQITPVNEKGNGKEKETINAKRVDKLVVSFDVENRIAKSGPADMYLMVTAPDGKAITESGNILSTRNDGDKNFTAKITVNYEQGTRQSVQFPILQNGFVPGNYKIEIYHNGFKIGEGTRSLKKSGLFG